MASKQITVEKFEQSSNLNVVQVLDIIREANEITRADIIKQSGLSAPTVTRIVESLIAQKLVMHYESGLSSGGRPPQILKFNSLTNYVIGIDIGGEFIRAVYSNLDGEFIYEIHIPTEVEIGFDGIMKKVGELIQKLVHRGEKNAGQVFGIGIAVCGVVHRVNEQVLYSPVLNWENVDIKKALKKYTDLSISVGNVANLIALGELFYGIGKNYDDFICVNLEYGIGSGIVINRQPFFGSTGFSGELGHIITNHSNGRIGRDGIDGALEAEASSYEIVNIVKQKLKAGGTKSSLENLNAISVSDIIEAANQGDELAGEVIQNATYLIANSIDILIKLFDPEAITINGGISVRDSFFNEILKKLEKTSLPNHPRIVPIIPSTFDEQGSLMGAFSLILNQIMKLEFTETNISGIQ